MTTRAVWTWLRRRATTLRTNPDRGSAVVEAVIIIPVIVILSMFIIQFALIWHARHLAESAAQNAVAAAAGYQSSTGRGEQSAAEFLAQVAPNLLTARNITVDRAPTAVRARVEANVLTVVPFADFTVTATASGPVERFAAEGS